jgi:2'-5' RNA ligase
MRRASVTGDERIRLFCAFQLPPASVAELVAWQHEQLPPAARPGDRLVPPANLHVTLAFLGSRPSVEVPAIATALVEAAGSCDQVQLRPVGYRETGRVGMIVYDDLGGAGGRVRARLAEQLEAIGAYRPEARPWLPHITVRRLEKREGLAPSVTNVRSISVVRAALYASALRPAGAQYDVLETVPLGGR